MARLLFFHFLILFTQIFSFLPSTAIAGEDPTREQPHDQQPTNGKPPSTDTSQGHPDAQDPHLPPSIPNGPQGSPPPFSNSDSKPAKDFKDLADKVKDLMDSLRNLLPTASTTSLSAIAPPAATALTSFPSNSTAAALPSVPLPTLEPNATLACEIYQSYTSLCPPTTVKQTTSAVPPDRSIIVDAYAASSSADRIRASCLCYSSSYYVPDVYDSAASACAGYTNYANNSTSAAVLFASAATAAAAAAAQTKHFCSSTHNVRGEASATFGQYTASTPTPTPNLPPSAAVTSSGPTSAAVRSYKAKSGTWAAAAAVVALAILI